jgi:hypothetical protein
MAIINYDGISGISSITATGSSVQFYNATGASSFTITPSGTGGASLGDVVVSSINSGPLAGLRNRIINGNFDIWQRGTSSSSTGYQTADRFRYSDNGTSITIAQSQQTFTIGQTDVPGEPTYFYRIAKTVAGSSGTFTAIEQGIEDVRTLAGQTATISFYAKTTSGTVSCSVYLAQYFGSGGSSNVNTSSTSLTLTTIWQKFTATVLVPSISGKTIGTGSALFFTLLLPNNATFTTDLAQVQVEAGSTATPFERRLITQELQLCERYYQVIKVLGNSYAGQYTNGGYFFGQSVSLHTKMRADPSVATYEGISGNAYWTEPGQTAFSAASTTGITVTGQSDTVSMVQTRQAGNSTPTRNFYYMWEQAFNFRLAAEL